MAKIPDVMAGGTTIPNLKGAYGGVPVNTLEYSSLETLVLLLDLRNLFLKKMEENVYLLEIKENFNFNSLKEECPDHYSNLLNSNATEYNISLIIEKFPMYYNFILNFTPNEITIEHFKEIYSELMDLLRQAINKLIQARKQVRNYAEQGITIIEKNIFVPKKIIWNGTLEELENLFNNLADHGYVNVESIKNLQSHFSISDVVKPEKSFNKIVWLGSDIELGVFMDKLKEDKLVKFYKNHINVAIREHFEDEVGKVYTNISQSRSNARETETKHTEFINLINSSL